MRMLILALAAFFWQAPPLFAQGTGAAALSRIGVAATVRGPVEIHAPARGVVGKVLGSGQPVYLNDTITTGPEGRLQIMLVDETVFTVGPNTSIVLDQFAYDPEKGVGRLSANALKGIFRIITGKINRQKDASVKIQLPVGVLGIFGTMVQVKIQTKIQADLPPENATPLPPSKSGETVKPAGSVPVGKFKLGADSPDLKVTEITVDLLEGKDAAKLVFPDNRVISIPPGDSVKYAVPADLKIAPSAIKVLKSDVDAKSLQSAAPPPPEGSTQGEGAGQQAVEGLRPTTVDVDDVIDLRTVLERNAIADDADRGASFGPQQAGTSGQQLPQGTWSGSINGVSMSVLFNGSSSVTVTYNNDVASVTNYPIALDGKVDLSSQVSGCGQYTLTGIKLAPAGGVVEGFTNLGTGQTISAIPLAAP